MAYNNGIIYVNTNTTPHGGVCIADIQQAVRSTKSDIGGLIRDGSINKWAKWKPIVHTALSGMTSAVRKTANQGFLVDETVAGNTGSLYQNSKERAFAAASANGQDWNYVKPTGVIGTSPFRFLDFANEDSLGSNGYNMGSMSPFRLFTCGIYPNADTPVGWQDFAVTWYYTAQQIAFTDLAVYDGKTSTHTWYWGLFAKIPGQNGAVSVIPIMTALHGSTKYAVGSPNGDLNIGFFSLEIQPTTVGTCEAYLGIYAVNNITQEANAHFIYAPVRVPSTFEITNPAAEIRFWWNQYVSGITGTTQGIQITYTAYQSAYLLTATSMHMLAYVPADLPSTLPSTFQVKVTTTITGVYQGAHGTSHFATGTFNVSRGTSSSTPIFIDIPVFDSTGSPIMVDDVMESLVSIEVQFGSETPFYLDPLTLEHRNYRIESSVQDILDVFGQNVLLLTLTT